MTATTRISAPAREAVGLPAPRACPAVFRAADARSPRPPEWPSDDRSALPLRCAGPRAAAARARGSHLLASRTARPRGAALVRARRRPRHHSTNIPTHVIMDSPPGAGGERSSGLEQRIEARVDCAALAAQLHEVVRGRVDDPREARLPGSAGAGGGGRHRTAPPRHQRGAERNRGATDRSVSPTDDLVELRGLEPLPPRLPGRAADQRASIDRKRRSPRRGKT